MNTINSMDKNNTDQFHQIISEHLNQSTFIKLILSNKRNKKQDLKSVTIKPIEIKKGIMLSFVYRYPTKDTTKNYSFDEAKTNIKELLKNTFSQGELLSAENSWQISINKKEIAKLSMAKLEKKITPQLLHDKQKRRLIATENNIYLKELGIITADEKLKTSMQDKFKQINKYIEIIEGILKSTKLDSPIHVTDMGSGKGYLTFALYDYLLNTLHLEPKVTGVEFRKELVEYCNSVAKKSNFEDLHFVEGTIETAKLEQVDLLIALHACDTATDDAIYRGIQSKAKIIICAPCCHKQIRKQINPSNELNLISQYGILKERQAEILTDTIRSQIMEAFGYKTKVFEFISTEHTPKNVIIVGTQTKQTDVPNKEIIEKIAAIKKMHGVEYHYLEKLLKIN